MSRTPALSLQVVAGSTAGLTSNFRDVAGGDDTLAPLERGDVNFLVGQEGEQRGARLDPLHPYPWVGVRGGSYTFSAPWSGRCGLFSLLQRSPARENRHQ